MRTLKGSYLLDRVTKYTTFRDPRAARAAGGWPASFSLVATRSAAGHLDAALLQLGNGGVNSILPMSAFLLLVLYT
jgi:hypothetical protein